MSAPSQCARMLKAIGRFLVEPFADLDKRRHMIRSLATSAAFGFGAFTCLILFIFACAVTGNIGTCP